MRIAYVTHTRFPTEKAHGSQIASVCTAMAQLGHAVTLYRPSVWNAVKTDPFGYYGIAKNFTVESLEHFDAQKSPFIPGSIGFAVNMWFYRNALRKNESIKHFDLLYVRSFMILPPLLRTGIPVIFEVHTLPKMGKSVFVSQCNRCKLIVCLTSLMKETLRSWGVAEEKLLVEGDGVDLSRFRNLPTNAVSKQKWHLPEDRKIVGYAGSLATRDTMEKGVGELVDAVALLRKADQKIFGWIIGGPPAWALRYEESAKRLGLTASDIRFEGRVSSGEIPGVLIGCDILVYPAPASRDPYFMRDTSPLKLFEYLASGIPIVCADLPPLRDVIDETCVTFCKPGDAQSLANAIEHVLGSPKKSADKAYEGKSRAENHSWLERMRRILAKTTHG